MKNFKNWSPRVYVLQNNNTKKIQNNVQKRRVSHEPFVLFTNSIDYLFT